MRKEEMYMRMAEVAAERSSCARSQVGAVITDIHMQNVLAVGYNGPPRRVQNGCPGDPTVPGACGCLHAEVNALIKAPFDGQQQILFVTMNPCVNCARLILNSGVVRVWYRNTYRNMVGAILLFQNGVEIEKLDS